MTRIITSDMVDADVYFDVLDEIESTDEEE
jgi:hypothetical protein